MVNWHDWQVFTNHFGNQTSPKASADDDIVSFDGAAMRDDTLDASVFDD